MNKEKALELLNKIQKDYVYHPYGDGWKKALDEELCWVGWFIEWLYGEGYEITPKEKETSGE